MITKGTITIDYDLDTQKEHNGLGLKLNIPSTIEEEDAAQILIRAYGIVASQVLQAHIIMGCEDCEANMIHTYILRGIDKAFSTEKDRHGSEDVW